ncbi:hypothetical protein ACIBG8_16905 [Nonomuraea sp. NPDC050556]|uniref:hypothetical protein n=1 Tax=Nonomuraea sp. NPDC050556 TaxID=3364369 RepID=UPI0037A8EAB6
MDGQERLFIFSTLECVRAAAETVDEQVALLLDDDAQPTIEQALQALRALEAETAQATNDLMHRMLEQARRTTPGCS